jgi:prepilin-type N-terminal cleavage/methylation domain-containing protein
MRQGFTLVETLVALLLFAIGMLAVAATGAMAARDLAIARRTSAARDVARNRIEALRASACVNPDGEGSAAPAPGLIEHWRVTPVGAGRDIVDSIAYQLPAGRSGSVVIRGGALCPP